MMLAIDQRWLNYILKDPSTEVSSTKSLRPQASMNLSHNQEVYFIKIYAGAVLYYSPFDDYTHIMCDTFAAAKYASNTFTYNEVLHSDQNKYFPDKTTPLHCIQVHALINETSHFRE